MSTSVRYDSQSYLDAWRTRGVYPSIHDAVVRMVLDRVRATSVLDLGCCTGLLARRLRDFCGVDVVGVDADLSAIERGRAAGVGVTLHHLRVTAETLPELAGVIHDHGVSCVVARRCLPEILGNEDTFDAEFTDALADSGVTEIVLEGRRPGGHRLHSRDTECNALWTRYEPVKRIGAVAYLRGHGC